ncbi:MAG: lipid-A-disaccharide synthase [Alphaproteobacteria bacterium]|nr:lipid-A-disaccharide synthase [Alphaproteobacteria bacterium]
MTHIYLIAGEASGDILGAKLMKALKVHQPDLVFSGIGGANMQEQGLKSLFPMKELSVMGLIEIIPKIFHFKKLIKETMADIKSKKPDLVITIDSPGFNKRVARGLQPRTIPLVHYVAPSVWAYRPGRAKTMAQLYDLLLALLPFEPAYFLPHGLRTVWVGHPVVEDPRGDGLAFRKKHGIAMHVPVLGVFVGSRLGEVQRLLPIYKEALALVKAKIPEFHVLVVTMPHLVATLEPSLTSLDLPMTLITDSHERMNAMAACSAALTKSGTVTVELARQQIPMVVAYKMNPLTAMIARWMLSIKYASLVNIILDRLVIPECIQDDCTPERLSHQVITLLSDQSVWNDQRQGMKEALQKMGLDAPKLPSENAALAVLAML